MGMFDEVTVSERFAVKLSCGCTTRDFQTKDLECEMAHYTIEDDGTCIRDYPGWIKTDRSPEIFVDPEGHFCMYDFCGSHDTWIDIVCIFRDGKVVRLAEVPEGGSVDEVIKSAIESLDRQAKKE